MGVLFFLRWLQVGEVDYQDPTTFNDWVAVVGFSLALGCLALALPTFAGLAGTHTAYRVSLFPAAGCALASIANLLEDGLQWSPAFWGFVIGVLVTTIGLLALTIAMAWTCLGANRLLCLVPALTLAGVLLFEAFGGILLLLAWLAAATITWRNTQVVADPQSR